MTVAENSALAYLARRTVVPQWRAFLRVLLETLGEQAERPTLLRLVGNRLAIATPLPPANSLSGLEARMNEALAQHEWGFVTLSVTPGAPSLRLVHAGCPALGLADDAEGVWVASVLEGLYATWLASLPMAGPGIVLRVIEARAGRIVLEYGKAG